jgi:hypothetical protein
MRRSATSWGSRWGRIGGRGLTGKVEFDRRYLQECGVLARDFAGLAAQSEMERRGNRRGDPGLFIGVIGASNLAGSKRIEEGRGGYSERRKRPPAKSTAGG